MEPKPEIKPEPEIKQIRVRKRALSVEEKREKLREEIITELNKLNIKIFPSGDFNIDTTNLLGQGKNKVYQKTRFAYCEIKKKISPSLQGG